MLGLAVLAVLFNMISSQNYRFIFSIFRHGARAPSRNITNGVDIFGNLWVSPGEVTSSGLRMNYILGRRTRAKYDVFLSSLYDTRELIVRTSIYNRTMMSAEAFLQGLYPNSGPVLTTYQENNAYPKFNGNLAGYRPSGGALPNGMQVFPIYQFQPDKYFFMYEFSSCPAMDDVFESNLNSDDIKNFKNTFKATYGEKLRSYFKWNDTTPLDNHNNLFAIADTFIADFQEGADLSALQNTGINLNDFNNTLYNFAQLDIYSYYNGGSDLMLARITVSIFLDEILMWMSNRVNYDLGKDFRYYGYKSPKIAAYSTHDVTLGSFLAYLKSVFNSTTYYTPYGSGLFIELVSNQNPQSLSDFFVNINYNDNDILVGYKYTDFIDKIRQNYWNEDQIFSKCNGVPVFVAWGFKNATIVLGVLLGVCFVLLIITLVCCIVFMKKSKRSSTAVLNTEMTNKA